MFRFGIIGAGNIARKFANAVNKCSEASLYAIASRDEEKAKKFAEEYNIPNAFKGYEEIYNNPNIDGVYIALTNTFHYENVIKCIEAKKAVLCEKPLGMSFEETRKMIQYANDNSVLLMEAMWTRFLPSMIKARQWIKEDKIGKVCMISSDFAFKCERDKESRILNKELGGGSILDLGVYCIDFALDFSGSKLKNSCGLIEKGDTGVDENVTGSLIFENGVVGNYMCGLKNLSPHFGIISGDKGYIVIPGFHATRKSMLYSKNGKLLETFLDEEENGFVYEVKHFCNLYNNKCLDSNLMPHSHTLISSRVMENLINNKPYFYSMVDFLKEKRTYRRFLQKDISEEIMDEIIESARISSSAGNKQTLRYIVIKSKDMVKQTNNLVKWAAYLKKEDGTPKEDEIPNMFVLVLQQEKYQETSNTDAGIAISNMTDTAFSYGIGSCIMGAIDRNKLCELFNIDEAFVIHTAVAFGYPAHESKIVEADNDNLKYYLDENKDYCVPKLNKETVVIKYL